MTKKKEIDIKVGVLKKVFDEYPENIKRKLSTSPGMVVMCTLMSEVPNLKIENDEELLTIQKRMVDYAGTFKIKLS